MRTTTLYPDIFFSSAHCELECEAHYDFEPAERGSRNEQSFAAQVILCKLMAGPVDLLPALPQSMVDQIAAQILQKELQGAYA